MSYTYLRHSRRPSQRAAPPAEDASFDALLDPTSLTSQTLVRTQILTNTQPSPLTIAEQAHTTEEPLPHIDYHLLSLLIRLVHPQLDTRSKKRYDYLIEARRWYYIGHAKFQEAYRELQDANAYGIILRKQYEQTAQDNPAPAEGAPSAEGAVEGTSTTAPSPSETTPHDHARRTNNETLRHLLLTVRHCAQARDHATSWLSSLKWKFLQQEMPPLVAYAEDLHAHSVKGRGAPPTFVGTLPPTMHLEPDASQRLGLSGQDRSVEVVTSAIVPAVRATGAAIPAVQEGGDDVEMDEGSTGAGPGVAALAPTLSI